MCTIKFIVQPVRMLIGDSGQTTFKNNYYYIMMSPAAAYVRMI